MAIKVHRVGTILPTFVVTALDDPDGCKIELVQWPLGHPPGLAAADLT